MTEISSVVDILARTLWGEARGCGANGMRHVASVVLNRAAHPRWWGHDVVSVCQAPYQFSCWLNSDPNLKKMKAVTSDDPQFRIALGIAEAAVVGKLSDETGGADSYFAASMKTPPSWAARSTKTFTDGWHLFFRVELPAERGQPDAPPVSVHAADPDHSADALMEEELRTLHPPT